MLQLSNVIAWLPRVVAGGVLALLSLAAFAQAGAWDSATGGLVPVPALSARVTDSTGTLSASAKQALEAKLAAWEAKTGNQLAILMLSTAHAEPIDAF